MMKIIGVDCAVQPENVGIAVGSFVEGGPGLIKHVEVGRKKMDLVAYLADLIADDECVLLALDAPLGWPSRMGEVLHQHEAGSVLGGLSNTANRLFQRETDLIVRAHTNKRPLDVGADRIARTAHAALLLLARLREHVGQPIPLAWEAGLPNASVAIEVYPAATMAARGWRVSSYKKKDAADSRMTLLSLIREELDIPVSFEEEIQKVDHAIDAVLCVLAGMDFLKSEVVTPEPTERQRKEGWIWFKGQD